MYQCPGLTTRVRLRVRQANMSLICESVFTLIDQCPLLSGLSFVAFIFIALTCVFVVVLLFSLSQAFFFSFFLFLVFFAIIATRQDEPFELMWFPAYNPNNSQALAPEKHFILPISHRLVFHSWHCSQRGKGDPYPSLCQSTLIASMII